MTQKLLQPKILLLVGMMGVGKTSLGRMMAHRLNLPFVDSDKEIEHMTGFTISDLFARYGEEEFKKGEEKVMERLLNGAPCVLSSGGGAFLSEATRALAKEKARIENLKQYERQYEQYGHRRSQALSFIHNNTPHIIS